MSENEREINCPLCIHESVCKYKLSTVTQCGHFSEIKLVTSHTPAAGTQAEHCDHEDICRFFYHDAKVAHNDGTRCVRNSEGCSGCTYDTRLRPASTHCQDEREKVLKLAADIWGVAACVKKENTEEFMEYFEGRMREFEKRYEELRQQQKGGE